MIGGGIKFARAMVAAGAISALAACATLTQGSDQSVTIITDPPGATCELERGGTILAVVSPTPAPVRLNKGAENIHITCRKEGYQDTTDDLFPEFDQATWGNILLGGIVGLAVDAGSIVANARCASIYRASTVLKSARCYHRAS